MKYNVDLYNKTKIKDEFVNSSCVFVPNIKLRSLLSQTQILTF